MIDGGGVLPLFQLDLGQVLPVTGIFRRQLDGLRDKDAGLLEGPVSFGLAGPLDQRTVLAASIGAGRWAQPASNSTSRKGVPNTVFFKGLSSRKIGCAHCTPAATDDT